MPDEPLRESAPLAYRWSMQLCRRPAHASGCAWLHGFWQCLRLLGVAADPVPHASLYRQGLSAVPGPRPQVLVSGAADYSMLAHVLADFRDRGIEPEVTVLDTCEAALRLNSWYAERVRCRLAVVRESILEHAAAQPYDAICTHSFFGQFSAAERPRLARAWRDLLRPGGRVITAHPLRPFGADEPNRFTPEQAAEVRAAVQARAFELAQTLQVSVEEVSEAAERYLQARYGYPVRSLAELRALLEQAGFVLEKAEEFAPPTTSPAASGGPGLRNARVRYAHLIAQRRR